MTEPPLNVDYWASLYSVYTDYTERYDDALESNRLVDRAEALWNWKGLNRSIPFDQISHTIEEIERDDYVDRNPEEAIEALSTRLNDEGVVESNSLVTSAFLLHLMASEANQYSVKFPIYDRRVWNAYVSLWRIRNEDERLYSQASQSPSQYGVFCQKFSQTCPSGKARDYERALFMFGGFVMNLPPKDAPTPIEAIDEKLESQENALTSMYDSSGYASVDLDRIRDSA